MFWRENGWSTVEQMEINIQMDWQSETPEPDFQKKCLNKSIFQMYNAMSFGFFCCFDDQTP